MPLSDCTIATSLETIDPTMSAGTVTLQSILVTEGGDQVAALKGSWPAITNPYVTGVQFEYVPVDSSAPSVVTIPQRSANNAWVGYAGVVSGKDYNVRYRAAGLASVFGLWSSYQTVTAAVVVSPAPAQPGSSAWSAIGTTSTANGVSFPSVVISGGFDGSGADGIVFFVGPHNGTLTQVGTFPLGTVSYPVGPPLVASGGVYDVGIAYANGESVGTMRVLNNGGSGYTAGAFAGSGATTDVTPTPLNWVDQSSSGAGTQTVTIPSPAAFASINAPIVVSLAYTNVASWSYSKNGGAYVPLASGDMVSIVLGDSLAYQCSNSSTVTSVLSIHNVTDGNALLDTVTATLTVTSTDVTPDAISIANINEDSYAGSDCYGYADPVTVNGINIPITLALAYTGTGSFFVDTGAGYVPIVSGGTFAMSNGGIFRLLGVGSGVGGHTGTFTLTNSSDGGATLASGTYSLHVHSGPWP